MISQSVKCLIWKDYRDYRALWWAMLFGAITILYLVIGIQVWEQSSGQATNNGTVRPITISETAAVLWLGIAVCFPAAIGATSFSREHEQQTFVFLRSLPVRSYTLLICRAAFVVVSTCMLLALLFAVGRFTASLSDRFEFTIDRNGVHLAVLSLLVAAEAFVIGVFFSVLTKHPLLALLWSGLVMMVLHGSGYFTDDRMAVFVATVSIVGFGALDVLCLPRWFKDGPLRRGSDSKAGTGGPVPVKISSHQGQSTDQHGFWRQMNHLIWQQWKSVGLLPILTIIIFAVLLVPAMAEFDRNLSILLPFVVTPAILCSLVFVPDISDRRYRFFSERGIHPRTLWIGRNAIGLLFVAASCIVLYFADGLTPTGNRSFALAPALAYAAVQVCILSTEQYIVGLFLALIAACLTTAWCGLTHVVSIPAAVGGIPLLVALFAAGYRRLADMMKEKSDALHKLIPWSIVVVGVIGTVVLTAIYRVQSIPYSRDMDRELIAIHNADSDFTPKQIAAFESYQRVAEMISAVPTPFEGRFAFSNIEDVEDAEERSTDNENPFDTEAGLTQEAPESILDWSDLDEISADERSWIDANRVPRPEIGDEAFAITTPRKNMWVERGSVLDFNNRAVRLLVASGRERTQSGDLSGASKDFKAALKVTEQLAAHGPVYLWIEAMYLEDLVLENLVWWAASDRQTSEAIEELRKWLTIRHAEPPSPIAALANDYVHAQKLIAAAPASFEAMNAYDAGTVTFAYRLMPWERTRTQRVLTWVVSSQYEWLKSPPFYFNRVGQKTFTDRVVSTRMDQINSTALARHFIHDEDSLLRLAMMLENRRRALNWQLRVIAYRIEHGEYPDSLSEVEDRLTSRDFDVTTDQVFTYVKSERKQIVSVNEPLGRFFIETGEPVIWSANDLGANYHSRNLRGTPYYLP